MATRKRNLIIAAVAAIVIAAAAVITTVTLTTQSEAEKVNNALALMSSPDNTDSVVCQAKHKNLTSKIQKTSRRKEGNRRLKHCRNGFTKRFQRDNKKESSNFNIDKMSKSIILKRFVHPAQFQQFNSA